MKKYVILFLLFVSISYLTTGQVESITSATTDTVGSPIVTKAGNALLSGLISISSLGGELSGRDRINSISFAPSYMHFVSDRIGFGAAVGLTRVSQGDENVSSWGFGPQVGYYFDNGHSVIPYLGGSVNYISVDDSRRKAAGFGINLGGGMLIRKAHLGVAIQGGYQYDNVKKERTAGRVSGGTIYFRFGFVGFIY